jgi:NAD(P)-dependent dehydrogenase (short-subunit alcohol dehydrogenase family)
VSETLIPEPVTNDRVDLGLADRAIIVTGGSSGIGLACVGALLAEGAMVTTCARDGARLRHATAAFDTRSCLALPADVQEPTAMEELVDAAVDRFGRLDGVAAIAGRGIPGRALELSTVDWQEEVMSKLGGVLNIVRAAIPHLRRSDGPRIVSLSAPTARDPDPAMAAVSAARAAVANLTRSLAIDLASEGIAVNAVAVGLIDTARQRERHESIATGQPYDRWLQAEAVRRAVPMRRAGEAYDVARLVVLALSPELNYTTGSVFDATGGVAGR